VGIPNKLKEMSSLAATQADGYYLPPEYFESGAYKKISKNQFAGSKGHNQYEQNGVVRFELPYKGICQGCSTSIGRGTRYNAKKVKADDTYFTTSIWEFVMTCRNAGCQETFRIRTNPQQRGFDFVAGISIQKGQEDDNDEPQQPQGAASNNMPTSHPKEPLSALERLESVARGKRQTMTELDQLKTLQTLNERTLLQDADSNAKIRAVFRKERNGKKLRLEHGASKGWSKGMELLAPTSNDAVQARRIVFGKTVQQLEKEKLAKVRKSSIFAPPGPTSSSSRTGRKRTILAVPVSSGAGVRGPSIRDSIILPPAVVHSNTTVDLTTLQPPLAKKQPAPSDLNMLGGSHHHTTTQSAATASMSSLQAMLAAYGSDSD
jgi:hypothetical protein